MPDATTCGCGPSEILTRDVIIAQVPQAVSRKPSAGRNQSELKAAVYRLTRNDRYITDLTMSWALIADEGSRVVGALRTYTLYYSCYQSVLCPFTECFA